MKLLQLPLFVLILHLATGCSDSGDSPPLVATDTKAEDSSVTLTTPVKEGIRENYGPERGIWQKPEIVISMLGDISDKTVADIGAGTGFFAKRLVQYAEKIIAIDADPSLIRYLDSIQVLEIPKDLQNRFETRLCPVTDSNLEDDEADIIMIVNTYIYLPNRVDYLRRLKAKLKENGKLLIINFKKKKLPPIIKAPQKDRVPLYQLENELIEAGYRLEVIDDTSLDYQYIVLAEEYL